VAKKQAKTISKAKASKPASRLQDIINAHWFSSIYAIAAVVILLATTIFWALLGAKIHGNNADQLVNTFLLDRNAVFRDALIPGAHTFLIKWPIFWLIKSLGASAGVFVIFTVLAALVTVAFLAVLLYVIDKRPLVFGTICLALASVLLMVPAQPYAGAFLPVNMAMLATRNLEYVFYLLSLLLLARSTRIKSFKFWSATALLVLVMASDKLFVLLSIGGALLAMLCYAFVQRWKFVTFMLHWLIASVLATFGSYTLLSLIGSSGITQIASQAGPYGLIHGPKDLIIGTTYALMGIFTNFGANPAFNAVLVKQIPSQIFTGLWNPGVLTYFVNLGILAAAGYATYKLVWDVIANRKVHDSRQDTTLNLATMLFWSTIAALGVYVVSNHYYAVDARYLTIAVFAGFIALAVFAKTRQWQPQLLTIVGGVISVAVILGCASAFRAYHHDNNAQATFRYRNNLITQIVKHHQVDVLVGDYWRVIPTKFHISKDTTVMPLTGCTEPRQVLNSGQWQPDLNTHSFAYLLSLDASLTDYPRCNIDQVTGQYGRPNSSVLIAGTLDKPKELLLFYDHGIHKSEPQIIQKVPSTILPIALGELPNTTCPVPMTMNIVAHQDDDLLFMNPDIIHDIDEGRCVRTVYLTAGDAGAGQFYRLNRERGAEAAYSEMLGTKDIVWIQRIVKLSDTEYITVANPKGNSKITLIFLGLPDGGQKGQGFASSHFETLGGLEAGKIKQIHSVDNQSAYSATQLVTVLTALMHIYQPSQIRTQSSFAGDTYSDHADHRAAGNYATKAYSDYEKQQYEGLVTIPLRYYVGYPGHSMAENVLGPDLTKKTTAFLAYAKYDGSVCQNMQLCDHSTVYGAYLKRQYQQTR
jgi:LmbE family N-acetylglucosaminyl deacetylase